MYFPHAQRDNLGILARVPLASGLLTGKYKPGATFAANDVRATFDAEKLKRDLAEVERLQKEEVPRRRADGAMGHGMVPEKSAGVRAHPRLQKSGTGARQCQRGGVGRI